MSGGKMGRPVIYSTGYERCPLCQGGIMYDSSRSANQGHKYLYFRCPHCKKGVRIGPDPRG